MELFIALILAALIGYVCYIVWTEQDGCDCSTQRARRAARQMPQQETAPLIVEPPVLFSAAMISPSAEVNATPIPSVAAPPVDVIPAVAMAPAYTAPIVEMPLSDATQLADVPPAEPIPAEDASTATSAALSPANLLLRNPLTGEAAALPNNYRFAKKWIKEALVAEGLLDKIYKNNELDAATSKKVKAALGQFKTLTQYHA